MNILTIIILLLFFVYSLLILYISLLAKIQEEDQAFINNFINFLILFLSLLINVNLISFYDDLQVDFLVFPFDILTISFFILFLPIFSIFIFKERIAVIKKQEKDRIQKKRYKILPIRYEIYRKLTHLIVLGIILFYFTLGFLTQHFFIYVIESLPITLSENIIKILSIESNSMIFTQYLVVFLVGISLLGLLTADFIRILYPRIYPLKFINRILREKEQHYRLGPQISMSIGCFSVIIIFGLFQPLGPFIICTAMIMSIFGDMASNLVGKTLGGKKIRNTDKTYSGLIAGITISFLSSIIFFLILKAYNLFGFFGFIFLPLIGSLLLGFLDYLDLIVDDNLTYPFILSNALFFLSLFFF